MPAEQREPAGVIEAIHGRRSIRAYDARPVQRSLVEDMLWDAVQAPTPPVSGDSPWALCVIEGGERIAAYGERAKQYALDHPPPGRPWTWPERPGFEVFWGAPLLVLICARRDVAQAEFDAHRAGQNLMLSAHARGLGSCWVGAPLPWLAAPEVAAELGLPARHSVAVAMILGHPAESPAGQPRPRPPIHWC